MGRSLSARGLGRRMSVVEIREGLGSVSREPIFQVDGMGIPEICAPPECPEAFHYSIKR